MPTYTFENTETKEVITEFMTIAERDRFLVEHPDFVQQLALPAICDPHRLGGVIKPDGGWREVLQKVKKRNRGSTVDTGNLSMV